MGSSARPAAIGPEFRWEFCHVYDELVQPMRLGAVWSRPRATIVGAILPSS
jgi:hypothetical protein